MREKEIWFLTCILHVYMGDTQEKMRNSERWLRIQAEIPLSVLKVEKKG